MSVPRRTRGSRTPRAERRTPRWPLAASWAAVLVGCQTANRPLVDRQDPARFESCTDPAGKAAYDEALQLLQAGDDARAVPLLRRVVETCPEHVVAHCYYQDAALHVGGEAVAAMRSFYGGMGDDGTSPVPGYVKARLLDSDFARKQAVDKVLARFGDFAYGYLSLARLNRSIGRLNEAATAFQKAIDRHPGLLAAHLELAETLVELGRFAEARLPYENYLRGAPFDRATVRAYVHLLLYRLGKPEPAMPWIDRLLADDPRDEAAMMDRAAAHWRAGRLDDALAGYLAVLEQRPDRARALLDVGYLHYDALARDDAARREHWPKARKAFQMYLAMVRPEDGYDWFEKVLAVPFRMKAIETMLGPDDGVAPTLADLR